MSDVLSVENEVSDHRAVFVPVYNKKCHRRKIWIYKDVNIDELRAEINDINWIDFFL